MANEENLIPISQRTTSEQREIARKGGLASGQVRRERKTLKEELMALLELIEEGQTESVSTRISATLISEALFGINKTKAFEVIRDTIGEKPVSNISLENSGEIKDIKISFVDKSNLKEGEEKDPKIVGEYTNPADVEDG